MNLKWLPILVLPIFISVTQSIEEWYPFSHFPMYRDPSPRSFYLYITDENNDPLPVAYMSGVRTAALKKRWKRRVKDAGNSYLNWEADAKKRDSVFEEVGIELLETLRKLSIDRKRPFPDNVKLMRADISFENDQFVEEVFQVAQEPEAKEEKSK